MLPIELLFSSLVSIDQKNCHISFDFPCFLLIFQVIASHNQENQGFPRSSYSPSIHPCISIQFASSVG
jgi:hypothetical protein